MIWCLWWYITFSLCFSWGSSLNFQINPEDFLEILIPTVKSSHAKCQNDSTFYIRELRRLKFWATQMLDASSKFPSGIFFGANFDFGNFDECIGVEVPGRFSGKYCMAKFHIIPPDVSKDRLGDNDEFLDASVWEKIAEFSQERSRSTRSDFYFSFCLPSTCEHDDLESNLNNIVKELNTKTNFKLTVSVDRRHCQIKNQFSLDSKDIAFLVVVLSFAMAVLMATCYDWLMKLEDLKKFKLEGAKHRLFLSFSLWTNLKKLNKKTRDDDGLQCIHGMKVISMFLIIMGHRIMFMIGSPVYNPDFVEDLYGRVETTVLLNGPIIVDSFFNISGFLTCYLMLQQIDKLKRGVNFFWLLLHRFIRLTPAYAIVLGFYCTIFVKLGTGPFWLDRVQVEQERCLNSWWTNLLYINNYINKDYICMFQSWYLTCDMHFFIIASLIIWILRKNTKVGLAVLVALIILSISAVFATVYINREDGILLLYMKFLRDPVINDTFKNIYIPTHLRASPYFVGMITGYIKHKMRTEGIKIQKYVSYTGWIACVFVIETTVYIAFIFYIPGQPYDEFFSAAYASLHHFTWSICISWMIIAMSEGSGSWIEPILAWRPLVLLSRITYTAFLSHGAIQMYWAATMRQATYASIFTLVFQTAADITLAYLCGLILSMYFEAPIMSIEKFLLGKEKKKKESLVTIQKITVDNRY